MDPLVAGLDASRLLVVAKEVLERAKADDRLGGVAILVLDAIARDELPAFEVDVSEEVLLPGVFDRRLEGEHKNAVKPHVTCELVGGKGLAKAHLCVPKKLWALDALSFHFLEVFRGATDGCLLLWSHGKVSDVLLAVVLPVADFEPSVAHVIGGTAIPFATNAFELVGSEPFMDLMVLEGRTVRPHGRFGKHDFVRLALAWLDDRKLLCDALFGANGGETNLEKPLVVRVFVLVGIDFRMVVRASGEGDGNHSSTSAVNSIDLILDSIKALSSSVSPYFLASISSVHSIDTSGIGQNAKVDLVKCWPEDS